MDTTSVRYVNADPAVKSAGFDLKHGKFVARSPGPPRGRVVAGRAPAIRPIAADTASGYPHPATAAGSGFVLPRFNPCRPTTPRCATARNCANPRRGAVHVWVGERAWIPTTDLWAN